MGKQHAALHALNRGEVSRFSVGRIDLERMRLSAEEQVNWQPWVLGPMMLRPGLQYIGGINDDLTCRPDHARIVLPEREQELPPRLGDSPVREGDERLGPVRDALGKTGHQASSAGSASMTAAFCSKAARSARSTLSAPAAKCSSSVPP